LKSHPLKISSCNIPGNSSKRVTGAWSQYVLVVDYDKCTKCMPTVMSAIRLNNTGFPNVGYNACKGCSICASECPVKAITMENEREDEKMKPTEAV
jgi:2-oxoacid:acceptor oxidoreductase delta subunit (pyruvate/2-ketoisovalerate family)